MKRQVENFPKTEGLHQVGINCVINAKNIGDIMNWQKKGLIIKPQKRLWWMQTHAFVPTIYHLEGSIYRIYFSGRDNKNICHIGYAEIDFNKPYEVLEYSLEPVLTIGDLGCFDDNGVTPSCVIDYEDKIYLYYIGWNKTSKVRMSLVTGLAVSNDRGKSFKRYSKAPLLRRTNSEPYNIVTGPSVLIDNSLWRMWYVSCLGWVNEDLPMYNVKYAESNDGINWDRKGQVCIDFKSLDEHSIARPYVIKENEKYKMWYSYKGSNYRIGYSESIDGIDWKRMDDQVGIDVSENGFDSAMIEFPNVFKFNDKYYMIYSGNNYGFDGVGLAIADE